MDNSVEGVGLTCLIGQLRKFTNEVPVVRSVLGLLEIDFCEYAGAIFFEAVVYLREQEDATHPDGTKSLRGSITKLTNVHAKAIVGIEIGSNASGSTTAKQALAFFRDFRVFGGKQRTPTNS